MNRVSSGIIAALFVVAAIEFGLLGASAAGLTGSGRDLPPVAERGVITDTATPTAAGTFTPTSTRTTLAFVSVTPTSTPPPIASWVYVSSSADVVDCAAGEPVTIVAYVTSSSGGPAADGTPVYFSVIAAGVADPPIAVTVNGFASSIVTPTANPASGLDIRVQSQDIEVSHTVSCLNGDTPTATPYVPPLPSDLTGAFMQADPLTIHCNGADTTWITSRLFQSNGAPAPDGTWAYFYVLNGYAEPYAVQTSGGYANTQVRLYGDSYGPGPNVIVSSGLLEAGIRVLCLPDSNTGCPLSPPHAVSPPCSTPNPTETPPVSPPQCHLSPPAISPPCATPSPFVSPPEATPTSWLRIAIDCDSGTSGVQPFCEPGAGVAEHRVDIVFLNEAEFDIDLAAFNFVVDAESFGRIVPIDIPAGNLDDNPDFNEQDLGADWACQPPEPRGDIGVGGAGHYVSFISCFRTLFGDSPVVPAGGSVVLASVVYEDAVGPAFNVVLRPENVSLYDGTGSDIGSCAPLTSAPITCEGAEILLGARASGPAPTQTSIVTRTPEPTNTLTQPPATPTIAVPTATAPPRTPTTPARTPTAPARTATAVVTRTPAPTKRCADIDGDGRVRLRDVRRIAERVARSGYEARYDINGDGRLSVRDAIAAVRQLGRRC